MVLFESHDFSGAEEQMRRAVSLDPGSSDAHYWLGLCLERRGDYAKADRRFEIAHGMDPEVHGLPARISRAECEEAVQDAIRRLPAEFREAIENVSIEIEDLPGERLLAQFDPPIDPCLLGLFDGVPIGERSTFDLPRLPGRIHIFQRNIERECEDREELVDEIFTTLYHEIGHQLGYEDDDLARLGYS